jgi:dTDP-4-dehydrorhamnose 3,5-epimerase
MLYKQTAFYAPQYERSLSWNDPALAIDWPLVGEPILSPKDQVGQPLEQAEIFP